MKDSTTLAYINLFAVLKDMEILCELDDTAKKLASPKKPVSIGFNVRGGPKATMRFENGACTVHEGLPGRVKLWLPSPEALNLMVDGKKTPLPYGGFFQLGFVLKNFMQLSDLLGGYLRATPEKLLDRAFFEKSTTMMFYLVAHALSVIGNYDSLGKIGAAKIPDGSIAMEIQNGPAAEILVKNGRMETLSRKAEHPRAYMIFADFDTARGLFDGSVESMSALAAGKIVMKGFIPMIDNLNKLLSRVAVYLG